MKFIATTEAECSAFKQGVEYADESGELNYSEPVERSDGLWQTVQIDSEDENED